MASSPVHTFALSPSNSRTLSFVPQLSLSNGNMATDLLRRFHIRKPSRKGSSLTPRPLSQADADALSSELTSGSSTNLTRSASTIDHRRGSPLADKINLRHPQNVSFGSDVRGNEPISASGDERNLRALEELHDEDLSEAALPSTSTTNRTLDKELMDSDDGENQNKDSNIGPVGRADGAADARNKSTNGVERPAQSPKEQDINALRTQLWKAREQRDALETELKQRQQEWNRKAGETNRSSRSKASVESQHLGDLQKRNEEMTKQNKYLEDKINVFQREMTEIQKRCSVLGLEINRLEKELRDRENKISAATVEMEALRSNRDSIAAELQQTQAMRNRAERASELSEQQLRHALTVLKEQLNESAKQNQSLQSDIEFYRMTLADRNNIIAYLNSTMANLYAEKVTIRSEVEQQWVGKLMQMRERVERIVERMEGWQKEEGKYIDECKGIAATLAGMLQEPAIQPGALGRRGSQRRSSIAEAQSTGKVPFDIPGSPGSRGGSDLTTWEALRERNVEARSSVPRFTDPTAVVEHHDSPNPEDEVTPNSPQSQQSPTEPGTLTGHSTVQSPTPISHQRSISNHKDQSSSLSPPPRAKDTAYTTFRAPRSRVPSTQTFGGDSKARLSDESNASSL
ncbi:uncharacterized protein EV422DRAFT_502461 [Fimicolochytrium jonesii]|uniref:uncharacterized protein n=1 Tax=Fimicolochytrium jonesii TaxID=1396493 RepID=UPI0022FDB1C8|nr:uncharacterized protein EV422DRAFT_502461 [Fimicolochytrium jonesii]KAI8826695.1 hypothetical protein EV422DRAFT_502461 [Fimicolochytrium jonesii]